MKRAVTVSSAPGFCVKVAEATVYDWTNALTARPESLMRVNGQAVGDNTVLGWGPALHQQELPFAADKMMLLCVLRRAFENVPVTL